MFTHPTPPSDRAMFSDGNRVQMPDHSQSAHARNALPGKIVGKSSKVVSIDGTGAHDAEPVCRQTTVPVSEHASHNGSQSRECGDGSFICAGNSGNDNARNPRAAFARTISAATTGSRSHVICNGMMRLGWVPAHTSLCQSFQAFTHARPSSGSSDRENTPPAKPAMSDGKHSEAAMPAVSMSM